MADAAQGKLSGQVALITGATSGIGRAIARSFLREGADVVVVGRRGERLSEVVREAEAMGRRAVAVEGDVREERTALHTPSRRRSTGWAGWTSSSTTPASPSTSV